MLDTHCSTQFQKDHTPNVDKFDLTTGKNFLTVSKLCKDKYLTKYTNFRSLRIFLMSKDLRYSLKKARVV